MKPFAFKPSLVSCLTLLTLSLGVGACEWGEIVDGWPEQAETGTPSGPESSDCSSLPEIECVEDTRELCSISEAQGDCALGIRSCAQGQWSACQPRFEATVEICGARVGDQYGAASGDEDCDGAIDEVDSKGGPQGCTVYMLDQDNDGWGAMGPSLEQDSLRGTYGCFCKLPPGYEHFKVAQGKENQDCGDCVEGGALVNPAASDFYTEPSSCLETLTNWKGGNYDYNCNGQKDYEWPEEGSFGSCGELEGGGCGYLGDGPWADGRPDCGEMGERPICRVESPDPGKAFCSRRGFTPGVQQGCR